MAMVASTSVTALRESGNPQLQRLHEDAWCTRRVATNLGQVILTLFFGRYPHRNGVDGTHEEDTYHDNTFRGQGQVDLWMMGEGQHHLHHAKNDVNYSVLTKVSAEIDEQNPAIASLARGTGRPETILELLEPGQIPDVTGTEHAVQMEPWERTLRVRAQTRSRWYRLPLRPKVRGIGEKRTKSVQAVT